MVQRHSKQRAERGNLSRHHGHVGQPHPPAAGLPPDAGVASERWRWRPCLLPSQSAAKQRLQGGGRRTVLLSCDVLRKVSHCWYGHQRESSLQPPNLSPRLALGRDCPQLFQGPATRRVAKAARHANGQRFRQPLLDTSLHSSTRAMKPPNCMASRRPHWIGAMTATDPLVFDFGTAVGPGQPSCGRSGHARRLDDGRWS